MDDKKVAHFQSFSEHNKQERREYLPHPVLRNKSEPFN